MIRTLNSMDLGGTYLNIVEVNARNPSPVIKSNKIFL